MRNLTKVFLVGFIFCFSSFAMADWVSYTVTQVFPQNNGDIQVFTNPPPSSGATGCQGDIWVLTNDDPIYDFKLEQIMYYFHAQKALNFDTFWGLNCLGGNPVIGPVLLPQ